MFGGVEILSMLSFYAASAQSCWHSLVLSLCGREKLFSGSFGASIRCVPMSACKRHVAAFLVCYYPEW